MRKKKLKICYVTGTRAEYGLMRHMLMSMDSAFDLSLLVVGMHMEKRFGYTVNDIEKDGFVILKKIKTLHPLDTGASMVKSLGLSVIKIAEVFSKNKPDIVVIVGDRGETLAGALVAAHMNIPIIHISGGDQGDGGASVDDSIRHSITKFAHLHCVSTKQSAQRIIKMGEENWRVHILGAPSLVEVKKEKLYSRSFLEKKYNISLYKDFIIAAQHSIVTEQDQAGKQMKETMEALKDMGMQTILLYPNADAGGRRMIDVIDKYKKYNVFHIYPSMPRKDYLSFLKYARLFVGNSSSGTVDTPSFKVPAINIGRRESTRQNAGNKIFVDHDRKKIKKAIIRAMNDKKFISKVKKCKNPYGDGSTDKKIISLINKYFPLTGKTRQRLLVKRLRY